MKNQHILKWALIASIVIVLNLFVNFSLQLVYTEPKFDDFCSRGQVNIIPNNQEECVATGGSWTETLVKPDSNEPGGYCDVYYTCGQEYEAARELYNRNVFIVLVTIGVLSLVLGFFTAGYSAVSLGFSFGGVLSLIIGTVRYWSMMDDYLRVVILGIALASLIWLGIKKIKD